MPRIIGKLPNVNVFFSVFSDMTLDHRFKKDHRNKTTLWKYVKSTQCEGIKDFQLLG